MLDEFELTKEHKIKLIHTMWNVMTSFKDQAFGLDSVQQVFALHARSNSKITTELLESNDPSLIRDFDNGQCEPE